MLTQHSDDSLSALIEGHFGGTFTANAVVSAPLQGRTLLHRKANPAKRQNSSNNFQIFAKNVFAQPFISHARDSGHNSPAKKGKDLVQAIKCWNAGPFQFLSPVGWLHLKLTLIAFWLR